MMPLMWKIKISQYNENQSSEVGAESFPKAIGIFTTPETMDTI